MESNRRGRPRKESNLNGSVPDYAIYLALIEKASGNVTKAAMELGHEGTKSFYNALDRLRKHVNGDMLKNDPNYDFLYAFDHESQKPIWTNKGLELVGIGEELLRTKKRYDDHEEKTRLRNAHIAKCKTPLYPNTEILVNMTVSESRHELIYACVSCAMMMRNFDTVEFRKWRDDHPELYSKPPLAFIKMDETVLKLG